MVSLAWPICFSIWNRIMLSSIRFSFSSTLDKLLVKVFLSTVSFCLDDTLTTSHLPWRPVSSEIFWCVELWDVQHRYGTSIPSLSLPLLVVPVKWEKTNRNDDETGIQILQVGIQDTSKKDRWSRHYKCQYDAGNAVENGRRGQRLAW